MGQLRLQPLRARWPLAIGLAASLIALAPRGAGGAGESQAPESERMAWWRAARFGMFIHWGLYTIPAGEWNGETDHAEWIRDTAHIPLPRYDQFATRFDPQQFDADAWVRAAKAAGMEYMVVTSKHHDGFCLFDSAHTQFDVAATPFGRDVIGELAEAARRHGLKFGLYYSIMDWHHPDYLPRRPWEENRPTEGADYERYVEYLKAQVEELLTRYGPLAVLWFDGQWEGTWKERHAREVATLVHELSPDTLINSRLTRGGGPYGLEPGRELGDFATPEQVIPETGLPGVDWESCMTMNDHWGYNRADENWKSAGELIQMLVDVASKGGNLLLNVGPTGSGAFPPEAEERLAAIGRWMRLHSEAIRGTSATPFPHLPWGRATARELAQGRTRLYLHVFDWPENASLRVPGLFNEPVQAFLLGHGPDRPLSIVRRGNDLELAVPAEAPDPHAGVVVLDIEGSPDVAVPPDIEAPTEIFVDTLQVTVSTPRERVELHYTTDGSDPGPESPVVARSLTLTETTTVSARAFRDGRPVSPVARARFERAAPLPTIDAPSPLDAGVCFDLYRGLWEVLPEFSTLRPEARGRLQSITSALWDREQGFGLRFEGFLEVPRDGAWTFHLLSDDGSRLWVDGRLVVDNDGLHSGFEKDGTAPLAAGLHRLRVDFFERSGGHQLRLEWSDPEGRRGPIPRDSLLAPSACRAR